jgi:hypothetical protein
MEPDNKNIIDDKKIQEFDDFVKLKCPNCGIDIIVLKEDIKCKKFKCGQYKDNGKPVRPHSSDKAIKKLKDNDLIYGCGISFRIKGKIVEICSSRKKK